MEALLIKQHSNGENDSFILDKESLQLIDEYIRYVRPLLNPLCDFLLVNRNCLQFAKLTDLMSKLVYDAIGKYIHPNLQAVYCHQS